MNVRYVDFNGQKIVIDELGNIVSSEDRVKFEKILSTKKTIDQIKKEIVFEESKVFSLTKPQEVPKKNFFKVFLKNFLKMSIVIVGATVFSILSCKYWLGPIPYGMSFMDLFLPLCLIDFIPCILIAEREASNEKMRYQRAMDQYQIMMEVYQLELEKEKRRNEKLPQLKERLAKEEKHLNQLVNEWEERNKLSLANSKLVSAKEQLEELKRLVLPDISTFEYNVKEKEGPVKVLK